MQLIFIVNCFYFFFDTDWWYFEEGTTSHSQTCEFQSLMINLKDQNLLDANWLNLFLCQYWINTIHLILTLFLTNVLFINWIYDYYENTDVRIENKTVENVSLMFKFDLFSFDEKDVKIFLLFLPHTNILAFSVIVLCMLREYLFVDCMIKFSFPSEMFYFPNQTVR